MPRLPIDYSRTVIYRISCNDLPEFIYIGSTTDFVNRKHSHKTACKTSEFKLYQTIRQNGNWDNWRMTIIEEYLDCKNCIEQKIREQKWIDELNSNLNSNKAYISEEQKKEQRKENYQQNREQILQKANEYYEQNRQKKKEYNIKYREQNKEKIAQHKKQHYEQNKEEILQQRKEYQEQNRAKIAQQRKELRQLKKE